MINIKLLRNFIYFFHIKIHTLIWCVFYPYNTTQFGLVTFQVLSSHMCPVAIVFSNGANEHQVASLAFFSNFLSHL